MEDLRARLVRLAGEVAGALVQSGRVTGDVARQTTVSAVEIALGSGMTDLAGREPSGTELDFAVAQLGSRMEDTGKHLIGPAPWLTCAGS